MARFIKVAAHKGASLLAPGNTLPSFVKAAELGADMMEIDVRTTADGELVVIHDPNVNGISDGSGLVEDLSLREIKALDVGEPFSPEFTRTRIPTLHEALKTIKRLGVEVNVEVKRARAEAVIEEIGSVGIEDTTMISSPDHTMLREARRMSPSIRILAMGLDSGRLSDTVEKLGPDALNFNRHTLNRGSYAQVAGTGVTIYQSILGGNDSVGGVRKAAKLGADIIETDHIPDCVQGLRELGYRENRDRT
jgi:glycerophosphoryl diester phosphodiesterase